MVGEDIGDEPADGYSTHRSPGTCCPDPQCDFMNHKRIKCDSCGHLCTECRRPHREIENVVDKLHGIIGDHHRVEITPIHDGDFRYDIELTEVECCESITSIHWVKSHTVIDGLQMLVREIENAVTP